MDWGQNRVRSTLKYSIVTNPIESTVIYRELRAGRVK